jgi:hypothetical protein
MVVGSEESLGPVSLDGLPLSTELLSAGAEHRVMATITVEPRQYTCVNIL